MWSCLAVIPAKLSDIDRIFKNVVNGRIGEGSGFTWAILFLIVYQGDNLPDRTSTLTEQRKNQADGIRFFVWFQGKAFLVREPDTVIAKWGDVADVFPSRTLARRPDCILRLMVLYSRRDMKRLNSKYSRSKSFPGS